MRGPLALKIIGVRIPFSYTNEAAAPAGSRVR
jgi:hypothetical protein